MVLKLCFLYQSHSSLVKKVLLVIFSLFNIIYLERTFLFFKRLIVLVSNSILCKLAELVFWCTPCLIIVENGWHHSKNGGYQLDILLTIPF